MMAFFQDGEFKGSVESEVLSGECKHEHAQTTGETCHDGCCDQYRCPSCGAVFMVECPD